MSSSEFSFGFDDSLFEMFVGGDSSSGETSDVSAPVTLDVASLEAFNPKSDPHGLSQRWKLSLIHI